MSDAPEAAGAAAQGKKSKSGLIIAIAIAVVTLIGGSVAGAVLGPKLLGGGQPKGEAAAEGEHGESQAHGESSGGAHGPAEKIKSISFPAVVVDLRDQDERIRHLKVGINIEAPDTVPEEEFKLYLPRGREAILTYIRSLNYEEVTDPARYESIKTELGKRVTEAVGAKRVRRVLIVEFVSQ